MNLAGVLGALTFVALIAPAAAVASPVTYACRLTDGMPAPDIMNDVDQIILDVEAKTLELRVARTMGTSNPINWIYTDGGREFERMITRSSGTVVWGAGISDIASYSYTFNTGLFMFSYTAVWPIMHYVWACDR